MVRAIFQEVMEEARPDLDCTRSDLNHNMKLVLNHDPHGWNIVMNICLLFDLFRQ